MHRVGLHRGILCLGGQCQCLLEQCVALTPVIILRLEGGEIDVALSVCGEGGDVIGQRGGALQGVGHGHSIYICQCVFPFFGECFGDKDAAQVALQRSGAADGEPVGEAHVNGAGPRGIFQRVALHDGDSLSRFRIYKGTAKRRAVVGRGSAVILIIFKIIGLDDIHRAAVVFSSGQVAQQSQFRARGCGVLREGQADRLAFLHGHAEFHHIVETARTKYARHFQPLAFHGHGLGARCLVEEREGRERGAALVDEKADSLAQRVARSVESRHLHQGTRRGLGQLAGGKQGRGK